MYENLQKEFEFYLRHQDELVRKYNGKVLAIKNEQVIGVYDSEWEAVSQTQKTEPLGTFIVQKCEPGDESYTMKFHSRVSFG